MACGRRGYQSLAGSRRARHRRDLLDQTKLPYDEVYLHLSDWRAVVEAIKALRVRGAPAIGVAGAAAVVLAASEVEKERPGSDDDFAVQLEEAAAAISHARPTAVNLSWAVDRVLDEARRVLAAEGRASVPASLYAFVKRLEEADEAANRAIGSHGAALLGPKSRILTHCNAGSLATAFYGTALGVVYAAAEQGKIEHVYADETRPLGPKSRILTHCNAGSLATAFYGTALGVVYAAAEQGKIEHVYADETRPVGQGARLTVWELARAGVPCTLLCDSMAASVMRAGLVDAVVVGADRIAANGDTANKIGTYGVAVLARHHGIPFYVAAPSSTVDVSCSDGTRIPIEQRAASEVLPAPIEGVEVFNPAFDVTPADLITAIVTEQGVFKPSELEGAFGRD